MIVVPDAGPLIYVAGAGHIELMRLLYEEVVVPRIVFDEVTVAGVGLTGAAEVSAATWLRVIDSAADPTLVDRLDPGEAAAIPLAEGGTDTVNWRGWSDVSSMASFVRVGFTAFWASSIWGKSLSTHSIASSDVPRFS